MVFILVGAAVNGGLNDARKPIGFVNWTVGDAPFVGGFGGFANVFVTAALSCEALEFLISKEQFSSLVQMEGRSRLVSLLAKPRIQHVTCHV